MTTSHRRMAASPFIWGGAALLLATPSVAMRFTHEVMWSASDFVIFGAMLGSAAAGYEFLSRRSATLAGRLGAATAVVAGLLLIWVNLAVGIIGSEDNSANLMYAGVIAIAVGGSIVARFRSRGMARAMVATAAAQVLVGAIAMVFALGLDGRRWPIDVIGATAILTAMWLFSAALFARARVMARS